jgi:hypothetical protein
VFRTEARQSPDVESLRVEAVRLMMEQSRHPIDVVVGKWVLLIATACAAPSCAPSDSRRR